MGRKMKAKFVNVVCKNCGKHKKRKVFGLLTPIYCGPVCRNRWNKNASYRRFVEAGGTKTDTEQMKERVRLKTIKAVKQGKILQKPCVVCGKKAQAHHPDYTKPLKVLWLCSAHHGQLHARLRKRAKESLDKLTGK